MISDSPGRQHNPGEGFPPSAAEGSKAFTPESGRVGLARCEQISRRGRRRRLRTELPLNVSRGEMILLTIYYHLACGQRLRSKLFSQCGKRTCMLSLSRPVGGSSSTSRRAHLSSPEIVSLTSLLPLSPIIATHMGLLLPLLLLLVFSRANGQPSPGYWPSSKFGVVRFYEAFGNIWGLSHQSVSPDKSSLTIWLDRSSGSGFKSVKPFRNGYFGASIKLHPGYTAGVITAFYLSNNEAHPGFHDEVDIEFLGTTPGKPYTLQTNVYVRGSGDGKVVGREMKFHLWFDPTAAFHHYAILWNPDEILFLVDDVPIRRYARESGATFPQRPMWVYGSIWDASSWATEGGRFKADYRYAPFVARFTHFTVGGCPADAPQSCHPVATSPGGSGLSARQAAALRWAQSKHLVYDYCKDPLRDHSPTPECSR